MRKHQDSWVGSMATVTSIKDGYEKFSPWVRAALIELKGENVSLKLDFESFRSDTKDQFTRVEGRLGDIEQSLQDVKNLLSTRASLEARETQTVVQTPTPANPKVMGLVKRFSTSPNPAPAGPTRATPPLETAPCSSSHEIVPPLETVSHPTATATVQTDITPSVKPMLQTASSQTSVSSRKITTSTVQTDITPITNIKSTSQTTSSQTNVPSCHMSTSTMPMDSNSMSISTTPKDNSSSKSTHTTSMNYSNVPGNSTVFTPSTNVNVLSTPNSSSLLTSFSNIQPPMTSTNPIVSPIADTTFVSSASNTIPPTPMPSNDPNVRQPNTQPSPSVLDFLAQSRPDEHQPRPSPSRQPSGPTPDPTLPTHTLAPVNAMGLSSEQWKILNRAVKQPNFDGKCENWKGFKRRWKLWFSMTQMEANMEGVLLVYSLPEQDSALYLEQIYRGMSCEDLWRTLDKRYGTNETYTLREQWHALRCEGNGLRDFEAFRLRWDSLREELGNVGPEEEKFHLMQAIPTEWQRRILKTETKRERQLTRKECEDLLLRHLADEEKVAGLQSQLDQRSPVLNMQTTTGVHTNPKPRDKPKPPPKNAFQSQHSHQHQPPSTQPYPQKQQRQHQHQQQQRWRKKRSDMKPELTHSSKPLNTPTTPTALKGSTKTFPKPFTSQPPSESRCFQCGKAGHVTMRCPTGECGRCGGKGHFMRNCNNTRKAKPRPDPFSCAGAVCFKCSQKGHLAAGCPNV